MIFTGKCQKSYTTIKKTVMYYGVEIDTIIWKKIVL